MASPANRREIATGELSPLEVKSAFRLSVKIGSDNFNHGRFAGPETMTLAEWLGGR